MNDKIKVLIIQRTCPYYRLPVFDKLSELFSLTVFTGAGTNSGGNKNMDLQNAPWCKILPSLGSYFELGVNGYYMPLFPSLIKEINKNEFDIIITEGATNFLNNLFLFFNRRKINTPIIWWGAGRQKNAPKNIFRTLAEPMLQWMIRNSQSCLAYGNKAKEYFARSHVPQSNIYTALNAKPVDDACQKVLTPHEVEALKSEMGMKNKKILLCAGALEKRKKIDLLLSLIQSLGRKDIDLVLLGDGCDEKRLKKLAQKLDIQDQVHFLGRIIKDRSTYFQMADIYIIPSKFGCSHTPMWYAKPLVVNQFNCDIDLVQHGVNGLIFKDDNLNDLKTYVIQLLNDPQLAQKLAANAKKMIAKNAGIDQMVQGFVNAVHGTIKQWN